MSALGLELRDTAAVAVALDADGAVLARSLVDSARGLEQAALEALDAVARAGSGPLGVATNLPDPSAAETVVATLRRQYAGPFLDHGPMCAGTAAAVAEAWTGAARGVRDVVYFAVTDHVIGGIVSDGAPLPGPRRRASSIAWLALNPVEREDYRKVGCLEAEVGAAGIVRRLIWRIKAGDASRVSEAVGSDLSLVTVDHVLQAARGGDGVSISVVRDTAKYLGMAAANLVIVAGADTLVLGGIMAAANDLLLEPVRVEVGRRLPRQAMKELSVVPAALGGDAAAIGAARLATAAMR
jgi:glucokinase